MPTIDIEVLIQSMRQADENPQYGTPPARQAAIQTPINYPGVNFMCREFRGITWTNFPDYWDSIPTWLWAYLGPGHTANGKRFKARNLQAAILRRSTNRWEMLPLRTIIGGNQGQAWVGTSAAGVSQYNAIRKLEGDGLYSYGLTGNVGVELWIHNSFYVITNRSLMLDAKAFAACAEVCCVNPDGSMYLGSDAPFSVALGYDLYASGFNVPNLGYSLSTMGSHMLDGGKSRWRTVRCTNGWTSVGLITMDAFKKETRPPWTSGYIQGSWDGRVNVPPDVLSEAEVRANPPPFVTVNGQVVTPTDPPAPPPSGGQRKEIWFAGNQAGSTQDGTAANPINNIATLRAAIQQYGSQGLDLRMKAGAIWSGIFPEEAVHYNNTIIRGDDWSSGTGYFEGGVRLTGWETIDGAPGGYQLWRKTNLTIEPTNISHLQAGCISVDDQVVAGIRWRGDVTATVAVMDNFADGGYSIDAANRVAYLLLPSGENPNTLPTYIAQWATCLSNWDFATLGNKRGGIILRDLRFKRYSAFGLNLANLHNMTLQRLYGKHIGGRYRTFGGTFRPEGSFIELIGGCDDYLVEDVRGEGIEYTVFSDRIVQDGAGFATQSRGLARRVTGNHVGACVADITPQVADGVFNSTPVFEDIKGSNIGAYAATGLRPDAILPDGISPAAVIISAPDTPNGGTTVVDEVTLRRVFATEAPVADVTLRGNNGSRRITFEACLGLSGGSVPFAFKAGQDRGNNGFTFFEFYACAVQGYVRGIVGTSGEQRTNYILLNDAFKGISAACVDMFNRTNVNATLTNVVAEDATRVVQGVSGSTTSGGGNYIVTGTTAGFTTTGDDSTGASALSYASNGLPAQPASGSGIYSGGETFTGQLLDYNKRQFGASSTWARGAYAAYAVPSQDTTPPPAGPPPVSGGVGTWLPRVNGDGDLLFLTPADEGTISGFQVSPTNISGIVGQTVQFSVTFIGTGNFNTAVTYSLVDNTGAVSVTSSGLATLLAVGSDKIRVRSVGAPNLFFDVPVKVDNFVEKPISADPPSLALDLVTGAETVRILQDGVGQAKLPVFSSAPEVAMVEKPFTGFDGSINVIPVTVGQAVLKVSKAGAVTGVEQVLEVPVTVTQGTRPGPVRAIALGAVVTPILRETTPLRILIVDQDGQPLPESPAAEVELSKPEYISAPARISNGELIVYPRGIGTTLVTVTFKDAEAGTLKLTFEVKVVRELDVEEPIPDPNDPPGYFTFIVELAT